MTSLGLRPQPFTSSQRGPASPIGISRLQCARPKRLALARASAAKEAEPLPSASTAKEAVERGLAAFEAGDPAAALQLFLRAQQLQPDGDEARAAAYNAACAHTRLRQWQPAVDAIKRAVNEYDLKLTVALNDPDLEALRERREWLEALSDMRGGCPGLFSCLAVSSLAVSSPLYEHLCDTLRYPAEQRRLLLALPQQAPSSAST